MRVRDFVYSVEKEINKKHILIIVFLAMSILYHYNFFDNTEIGEFNRIQGMATAGNVDVGKLISNFNYWFFYFIVLFLLGIGLFTCFIKRTNKYKREDISKVIDNLSGLVLVSSISLLMSYVTKYSESTNVMNIFVGISFWSVLFILLYYIFSKDKINMLKWDDFKWIMIISLSIDLIVNVFVLHYISSLYPILFLIFIFVSALMKKKEWLSRLKYATIPIHFVLFAICIYSEFSVILNQNHIYMCDARIIYFLIILLCISYCVYRFVKKSTISYKRCWEHYTYIGLVFSISLLVGLPRITAEINVDLFEQANTALPISQLFMFGKIPIIETHSAHMLSDFIFGVAYKIFNRDIIGSFFGLYNGLESSITLIIFYYLLKEFFHKDFVLLFILFFPFYFGTSMLWSSICFLAVLSLLYLVKKKNTLSYYLFWCTLAFSVLYKGDIGLAIGVGCILTLITISIMWKGIIDYKKIIIAFLQEVIIFLLIYLIVCWTKGISPIDRALEFMSIMLKSNQNWAYGYIGDTTSLAFSLAYIVVPIAVLLILFHLLWLIYINAKQPSIDRNRLVLMISLAFAYFINFSRIIVRHSLVERPLINLIFTAAILIPLYFCFIKKKKIKYYILPFFAVMIFSEASVSQKAPRFSSSFDIAEERISDSNTFVKTLGNQKITRVEISNELKNSYVPIVNEINYILEDNETFLDFSNQTMIYSLAGRENPVYVSQSPGLLIDDFTQDRFIEEVKESDKEIPIVIMANNDIKFGLNVDGILNTYKYYRVAEFIYHNYEPVEVVGDYAIWCKRDREDIKEKITSKNKSVNLKDLDFENFQYDNTNINVNEQGVIFNSTVDPYLNEFEKIVPKIAASELDVRIEYSAEVDGIVQFYYTTAENPDYVEKNSVSVKVTKGDGEFKIQLPYRENIHYRMDLPDQSIFTLKNIHFNNTNINDSYYNEIAHSYQLGDIPYLWSNYDVENANSNDILLNIDNKGDNTINLNTKAFNKEHGNYLLITLDALDNETVNLELGKKGSGAYSKLTNYSFNVKKGEHTYLLRVSSDYFWASNQYDYLRVYYEGAKIKELKILEGD